MRLMINIGGLLILFSIMIAILLGFFIIMGLLLSRPLSSNELSLLWEIWSYCWKFFLAGLACMSIALLPLVIKN